MLYCPGKGHELLSALGVTVVCHASNGIGRPTSYTKFPVQIVRGVILGKPAELLIREKKNS